MKTQMPYALTVGLLAMILGCLGVGYGVPVSVILITGSIILFIIIRYMGQLVA